MSSRMYKNTRNGLVTILAAAVLNLSSPLMARAEIIGTLTGIESQQRSSDLGRINAALDRAEVRAQLESMGVESAQVEQRLASLTDQELRSLADQIESAPAGAGLLAVVGVVFVVLLVLEAVGVIDIFKKFP